MNLLKDPLVHFVITGGLLFGAYSFINGSAANVTSAQSVRIGEGEVRWLRETFSSQWRRNPDPGEMDALLATLVEEELLAREARSLGLDQNDTIVRRRLAQKMIFMVTDTSDAGQPTEDELRRYYDTQVGRYRTEARFTFRHAQFSASRRPRPEVDAAAALAALQARDNADQATLGDPILIDATFADIDQNALDSMFGPTFARQLTAAPTGTWTGPLSSAFGSHLVFVTAIRAPLIQPFESLRTRLVADWRRDSEQKRRSELLGRLRAKFGVVIDENAKPLLGSAIQASAAQ